jgi:iron complex outermembrane receptor protein
VGNVILKASATRNYRFPTLNDLYYKPGGNPALKPEEGISYDIGISADHSWQGLGIKGRVTWFDSYISNWILWLPTFNGYWSPTNVRSVHCYGIESSIGGFWEIGHGWKIALDGCFAWTPAINRGDESWSSAAHGKQLVYIPEYSSSIVGTVSWRGWEFRYRWNYYSERYTTSSNQTATRLGVIQPYFMSDISLGKRYSCEWGTFGAKFTINNLFNEEYESVLSRPMPRQNYYLTLEFAPAVLTSRGQRNR